MFKSIDYKLFFFLALLIVSVSLTTYFFLNGHVEYGIGCAFVGCYSVNRLYRNYRRFNQNILFLLNALDNGDYSFNFSVTKISEREKELNLMMNRIKEILVKAKREVIQNEKFLSLIVESVDTGIIILDENNHIRTINQSAKHLLGLYVLTHLNQLRNIDESFPELFTGMKAGETAQIKVSNEREEMQLSIRLSQILVQGNPIKIFTLNNIGNELEAKEMESWIKLIRVMTHEIMNSIAPITSLSEALLFSYQSRDGKEIDESLQNNTIEAFETIHSTAKGLISFVESYRKFTGIPKPQLTTFELIPLLENVVQLEQPTLTGKGIEIELLSENHSFSLHADKPQILQVLVNLVKNAAEAIEGQENGKIEIRVMEINGHINIDVRNNGEPIPESVLPHIFIPFFTTKDSGSGIGLSISRYIMRLHGGNLKHHTADGWTVFSMVF